MTAPSEEDWMVINSSDPDNDFPMHPIMKYAWAVTKALQLHYQCNRQELSYKTNISLATISKILNGHLATVSLETLTRLEAAVDVMMDEVIKKVEEEE